MSQIRNLNLEWDGLSPIYLNMPLIRRVLRQQMAWTRARRFEREMHVSRLRTATADVLRCVLSPLPASTLQRVDRRLAGTSGCPESSTVVARSGRVVETSSSCRSRTKSSRQSDVSESIANDFSGRRLCRSPLGVTLASHDDVAMTSHSDTGRWTDDDANEWVLLTLVGCVSTCSHDIWAQVINIHDIWYDIIVRYGRA